MKRLLFIGCDFHLKTGSSKFLTEILDAQFSVTKIFIDLDHNDPYRVLYDFEGEYFDHLVCWQIMPPKSILQTLFSFKKASLFPMYDAAPSHLKMEKWIRFKDFNIVCFSKKLFIKLKKIGLSAHYIQYFPKPAKTLLLGDPYSIFFWARRNEMNLKRLEAWLTALKVKSVHLHNCPDPKNSCHGVEWFSSCKYTFSKWFENKREMLEKMEESALYLAPRMKEGIGMSFLEAMASGRCIFINDESTMNEYVDHGLTGINIAMPVKNFSSDEIVNIQRKTYEFMCQGYEKWDIEKAKILDWMGQMPKVCFFRLRLYLFLRFLKNPIKVIKNYIE